ncbi:hypothetical protein ABK040_002634 [Willaertia magna]
MSSSQSAPNPSDEDDFGPSLPPSFVKQQQHEENVNNDSGEEKVLIEYSLRDFERYVSVGAKDIIAYQSGKKSFYDIVYDKKTPCGELYETMIDYLADLTPEDLRNQNIKDTQLKKDFKDCIDLHYHLYDVRAKNVARAIGENEK